MNCFSCFHSIVQIVIVTTNIRSLLWTLVCNDVYVKAITLSSLVIHRFRYAHKFQMVLKFGHALLLLHVVFGAFLLVFQTSLPHFVLCVNRSVSAMLRDGNR